MNYNNIKNPNDLLEYMNSYITYGFVSKTGKIYNNPESEEYENNWYLNSIVQNGKSVVNTKHGTCWDQVELERMWFIDNNYKFKTYFIQLQGNRKVWPTHTFLIYEDDNKYYWFEHAFNDNKGIHEFNTVDEAIEMVKYKHLKFNIDLNTATKEDYEFIVTYEYSEPKSNLSVDEYIEHVTKKEKLKTYN